MSIFPQAFHINIDLGISALGNGREVVYRLNDTDKRLIFHFMATVKLIVSQWYDTKIDIHTTEHNADVGLAK